LSLYFLGSILALHQLNLLAAAKLNTTPNSTILLSM
jgi:hypothetical protein